MITDQCGYKQMNYYIGVCESCDGLNPERVCYTTEAQIRKHTEEFEKLQLRLEETDRIGRLENLGI